MLLQLPACPVGAAPPRRPWRWRRTALAPGQTQSPRRAAAKAAAQHGPAQSGAAGAAASAGRLTEVPLADPRGGLAAYLRQHGLDPAELQRLQPAAYAQLTVPLATVFVAVHQGVQAAGEKGRIARQVGGGGGEDGGGAGRRGGAPDPQQSEPAALMARVCLLHTQVGLLPEDLAELWRQEPQIFMFRLDDGDAPVLERLSGCLAWLLAMGFSREEVSGVWRTQLRMFRLPAELLQRNLASLRSRVPLSAEQQRRFVASSGALLGTDYEALLAKLDSLVTSVPSMRHHLSGLLAQGGPELGLKLDSILRKVSYLRKYGFTKKQVSEIARSHPLSLMSCGLLECDPGRCDRAIKPLLVALEQALGSPGAVIQAVCAQPGLLGMSVKAIPAMAGELQRELAQLGLAAQAEAEAKARQ